MPQPRVSPRAAATLVPAGIPRSRNSACGVKSTSQPAQEHPAQRHTFQRGRSSQSTRAVAARPAGTVQVSLSSSGTQVNRGSRLSTSRAATSDATRMLNFAGGKPSAPAHAQPEPGQCRERREATFTSSATRACHAWSCEDDGIACRMRTTARPVQVVRTVDDLADLVFEASSASGANAHGRSCTWRAIAMTAAWLVENSTSRSSGR